MPFQPRLKLWQTLYGIRQVIIKAEGKNRVMQNIIIKRLATIDELQQLQKVEEAVWNVATIPIHQTYTALNNGGIIIGAFDRDELIGYLYSFPGFRNGQAYICSHMLGILPPYRTNNLGVKLKQKQAEIAKDAGFSMITWTFDPLESKNAYINLHQLQAVGAIYLENHYGNLNDGLNTGLPTDRIQIIWEMKLSNKQIDHLDETQILLTVDEQRRPSQKTQDITKGKRWFVGIPGDFQTIKTNDFSLAKEWRFESRAIFQRLFALGFKAVDYIYDADNTQGFYVFEHQ